MPEDLAELIEMIVVVAREARHPLAQAHAPACLVDAAALPLRRGERVEQGDDLAAPATEGLERPDRVLAFVLPVVGPAIRVERVADLPADPPCREGFRRGAEGEDLRVIRREDGLEPNEEQLLDVAQVADDLTGRPPARVGPAGAGRPAAAPHPAGPAPRPPPEAAEAD